MDIIIQKNIPVPMRDDITLATDVYRPADGVPAPTLVMRSPYNKEFPRILMITIDVLRAVQTGYAVVIQDCRGRFLSTGAFDPFFQEAQDGVDTIEWAASQPWSNGKVGTVGASYVGATQWLAAAQAPAALRALAPFLTTDQYYNGWTYQGGAFQLGFALSWALGLAQAEVARQVPGPVGMNDLIDALDHIDALYQALPLTHVPQIERLAPYYFAWLAHPSYDDYWRSIAPREAYARISAPALNIGGWFDIFLGGTLANYCGMRANGGSADARRQRLIIGPWSHGYFGNMYVEQDYGILASTDAADLTGAQLRWFDYWLKDAKDGVTEDAPVTIFVMGSNQWRTEADWPLPDTQYRSYYLHSGGAANTVDGDGVLSQTAPENEPPDVYTYRPLNPVPTAGGQSLLPGAMIALNVGPRDQRNVERRPDVLCYTTPPLERDTEVTGPITLVLYIASSARDTDFTGKLVDVFPDGRALALTDGILRARYRSSLATPELLDPDTIYELHIDLIATSNVFRAGHRIRLDVSSSNFPRFDRNTNTGGTIAAETATDCVPAINRIFHDQAHPSHVLLPIIERD
jgi:putative CocE/NonD family hydrolase